MKKLDFDFHFLTFIRVIWLYIRYASFRPLVNDAIKLFGLKGRLPSDPAATKPAPTPVSTPPPVVQKRPSPVHPASPPTQFYDGLQPPPRGERVRTPEEQLGNLPTAAGAGIMTARVVEQSARKQRVRRLLTTLPKFEDLQNRCPGCKRRLIQRENGELYCIHCRDSYP